VPKKGPSDHKPIRHTIRKLKTTDWLNEEGSRPDSNCRALTCRYDRLPATVDIADPDGSEWHHLAHHVRLAHRGIRRLTDYATGGTVDVNVDECRQSHLTNVTMQAFRLLGQ
jgi:hypothetical protein